MTTATAWISARRGGISRATNNRRAAVVGLAEARDKKKKAKTFVADSESAVLSIQMLSKEIQSAAHSQIAGIVSRCLRAVFDEPYEFSIVFETKRNKTEAVLSFIRNGDSIDPMTASGGGVVDVAAFALRVAALSLSEPRLRPLLILDEPFKFVSKEYIVRVREMIESLEAEMCIQFIIISHIKDLRCGNVIDIRN